jgi:hypothetical protein
MKTLILPELFLGEKLITSIIMEEELGDFII